MVRRRPDTQHLDTDGLQADVMRFLAIIAFCLIAMLALVKNLDRTASEPVRVEPVELPAPVSQSIAPEPVQTLQEPVEVVAETVPQADASPEPLTFRFASEGDFLHLLSVGEVRLYASTADGFLRLTDDFTLTDERPMAEVYEVLPNSVPSQIVRIFAAADDGTGTVYLVDLPQRTRRELEAILAAMDPAQASGALVIHRDGHVSHES